MRMVWKFSAMILLADYAFKENIVEKPREYKQILCCSITM